MTSNDAREIQWATSMIAFATRGGVVTSVVSHFSAMMSFHFSASSSAFLKKTGVICLTDWWVNAGAMILLCIVWAEPSIENIPRPMSLPRNARVCQGFSYPEVLKTCVTTRRSKDIRRRSCWTSVRQGNQRPKTHTLPKPCSRNVCPKRARQSLWFSELTSGL